MEFTLNETIAFPDSEEVLRMLEQNLRVVAEEVVRTRGKITVYGIGASPRIVNRKDKTVIEAAMVDGRTALTSHVSYQASGLLGGSPQNEIVRQKIDGAISATRAQLEVVSTRDGSKQQAAAEPVQSVDTSAAHPPRVRVFVSKTEAGEAPHPSLPVSAPVARPSPPSTPSTASQVRSVEESLQLAEAVVGGGEALGTGGTATLAGGATASVPGERLAGAAVAEAAVAEAAGAEAAVAARSIPAIVTEGPRADVRAAQPAVVSELPTKSADRVLPTSDVPLKGLLRGQGLAEVGESKDSPGRGRWRTVAIVLLVLVLLAVVAAYVFRDQLPLPEAWKVAVAGWTGQLGTTFSSFGRHDRTKELATAPTRSSVPVRDPLIIPAPETAVKPEVNLYLWVKDWANALRSRDPVAQASYYADRVDFYLTLPGVSNDFVREAKEVSIHRRKPMWTLRVEHVFIESQSASSARLRVVKHAIFQAVPGQTSEDLVKTRLKLKRDGATWKIVEEQEMN